MSRDEKKEGNPPTQEEIQHAKENHKLFCRELGHHMA